MKFSFVCVFVMRKRTRRVYTEKKKQMTLVGSIIVQRTVLLLLLLSNVFVSPDFAALFRCRRWRRRRGRIRFGFGDVAALRATGQFQFDGHQSAVN